MNRLLITACVGVLMLCTASAQAAGKQLAAPRASTVPGITAPVVPPSAPAIPRLQPATPAPQVAVPPAQGLIMPSSAAVMPTQPAQVPTDPALAPVTTNTQYGTGQP